jgi:anaerobic selenocysteine-containing dehydrogenase
MTGLMGMPGHMVVIGLGRSSAFGNKSIVVKNKHLIKYRIIKHLIHT